jgi:hypothetical protein
LTRWLDASGDCGYSASVGRLRRAARFLRANLESGKRGSEWRGEAYKKTPSAILGAGAAGQFRDANAWCEVVPWLPVEDAMRRYAAWKLTVALSAEQLEGKTRVETRGTDQSEMRVLASPDLKLG